MSRDKQIEEMAVENLVAFLWHNTAMYDEDLIFDVAEALVNEGYRKAEDVAREIFEEIEKTTASVYNDFMFNRDGVGMRAHYVVEFSDELDLAIAELKKKYTEGEKDNG